MNESLKPRFAVDLDEIERQLAQSESAPGHEAYREPRPDPRDDGRIAAGPASSRSDPLAELARIVGQDDPFQSILGSDKARLARPRPSGHDNVYAHPGAVMGLDEPRPPSHGEPEVEPYDPAYQDLPYDSGEPMPPQAALDAAPRNARRRGLVAIGAVVGCAVLGLGGAFALKGQGKLLGGGGEPPLIKAANEPVKVAPQSPGGIEIPNQNKQIYERAQDGQTKVVNREEQPVDVRQAARAASPETTGGLNLGEPRKVRTVAIRLQPDGTVIPDGAAAPPGPSGQSMAALQLPPAAAGAAPAAQPAPSTAAAAAARAAATAPKPATATPTTRSAASPATGTVATPAAPTAPAKPAAAPAAPAQRVAAAAPPAADPAAGAAAAPTGGFVVQLGVSPSEAEAKATLTRMQSKFADLGSASPLIRKAEVNGNTVYRVRVGPMAKDDASSLCSKIQGQGGQCFVAKN